MLVFEINISFLIFMEYLIIQSVQSHCQRSQWARRGVNIFMHGKTRARKIREITLIYYKSCVKMLNRSYGGCILNSNTTKSEHSAWKSGQITWHDTRITSTGGRLTFPSSSAATADARSEKTICESHKDRLVRTHREKTRTIHGQTMWVGERKPTRTKWWSQSGKVTRRVDPTQNGWRPREEENELKPANFVQSWMLVRKSGNCSVLFAPRVTSDKWRTE